LSQGSNKNIDILMFRYTINNSKQFVLLSAKEERKYSLSLILRIIAMRVPKNKFYRCLKYNVYDIFHLILGALFLFTLPVHSKKYIITISQIIK